MPITPTTAKYISIRARLAYPAHLELDDIVNCEHENSWFALCVHLPAVIFRSGFIFARLCVMFVVLVTLPRQQKAFAEIMAGPEQGGHDR